MTITTEKLEGIGLKHWQKNGMDRIYINIAPDAEYDERTARCFFNRHEWQNLKIYWDVNSQELVISTGSDDAKEAVTAIIKQMVNK